ncbi:hypothetical protein GCM10022226_04110 [Sphaerisporangium flaviroseum]|uniref:Uncharacterized protein n=1 Tax=Sphaerisporangium flaviroseum TaxID=509199 RepID=A0ABP7H916_9ACTN
MEDGEDDLDGRALLTGDDADGDATTVVHYPDTIVRQQRDLDVVGVTGECLVHGVVHDLLDEVMEATLSGGADIHTRALTNRLKSFENGD